MELSTFWFILIGVLFAGYFLLEGFDFGVGMLVGLLAKNDRERRTVINTIGPVWDGNEVWLLTGGGAMFAAFPEWYSTLFSGFYIPLFIIVVALILRGVAFEYRGKRDDDAWRRNWDWCIIIGSFLPALLWGVAVANIVRGVPIEAGATGGFDFVGNFFDLLSGYALLGGLVTLTVFLTHGAFFVALKTTGDLRVRAHQLAQRCALAAAALAVIFIGWTAVDADKVAVWILGAVVAVAFVGGLVASLKDHDGWAFAGTAVAVVAFTAMAFTALFPNVLPSTINEAYNLTVTNASSTHLTLQIMSWVAVIFTPIVVGYQAWTYWVFRKRISVEQIPASH